MKDVNGIGPVERLTSDVRFGWRLLRRNPLFAGIAVLTLALGIGASTAIFSVVDGILLRSLPYPDSQQLVSVWSDYSRRGGPEREWLSYPNYADLRDELADVAALATFADWGPTLTGEGDAEQLVGAVVSQPMLESVLAVQPELGRSFQAADDRPGAPPVVILGYGLWQRRFAGERDVLDRVITLDGEAHTVIGVLPRGFRQPFLPTVEIWAPLRWDRSDHGGGRGSAIIRALGRIDDSSDLATVQARAETAAQRLEQGYPEDNAEIGAAVFSLKSDMVEPARVGLWVLLGSVLAVLLIVCVNLANLMLARGAAREGELALRAAMGAGRGRIVRQLLTESVLLSTLGGVLGGALAFAATRGLVAMAPPGTPRIDEVAVDLRVLGFAAVAALLCGVAFGLAPALRSARVDLRTTLHAAGRSGGGSSGRLQAVLVAAQVALALVLLIGAGLLLRSFRELIRLDLGFDPDGVVTAFVTAPPSRYPEIDAVPGHYALLEERIGALPGVESVATIQSLPLSDFNLDSNFHVEGRPIPEAGEENIAWLRRVTPGYFETMRLRLLAGRTFSDSDGRDASLVVVVNETVARRYFGDDDAIGRRINVNSLENPRWREIVGVVGDVKAFGMRVEKRNAIYFPLAQLPSRPMYLVARTDGDPEALVPQMRSAIASLDPDAAPTVATMRSIVSGSLALDRFLTVLLTLFAAVAMVLAAVGLYGVVSYGVNRQLREIGVRLALGAGGGEIAGWVVRRSLRLSSVGVVVGVLGALLMTRWMAGILFQVSPLDLTTFAAVVALMIAVSVLASVMPAWRAASVDPVRVLRSD